MGANMDMTGMVGDGRSWHLALFAALQRFSRAPAVVEKEWTAGCQQPDHCAMNQQAQTQPRAG